MANPVSNQVRGIINYAQELRQTASTLNNQPNVDQQIVDDLEIAVGNLIIQADELELVAKNVIDPIILDTNKTILVLKQKITPNSNLGQEIEKLNKTVLALSENMYTGDIGEAKKEFNALQGRLKNLYQQANGQFPQELGTARDNLQEIGNGLKIALSHETLKNSLQTKKGVQNLTVGTISQFNGVGNGMGNSACGVIALHGLKFLLSQGIMSVENIDKVVKDGIADLGPALNRIENKHSVNINYGQHIDSEHLTDAVPGFVAVQDLPIQIELNPGQEEADQKEVLDKLAQLTKKPGDQVGAVMTKQPETYSLVVKRTAEHAFEVLFFDSHGNHTTTGSTNAYLYRFLNLNDAARFLAKRLPAIEGVPMYNYVNVLPLRLDQQAQPVITPALVPQPKPIVVPNTPQPVIKAVKDLEEVLNLLNLTNDRNDLLSSLDVLLAYHVSDKTTYPVDYQDRVCYHIYFHDLKVKKREDVEGKDNYGGKTLRNEQTPLQTIHTCMGRVRLEILMNTLTEAVENNDIGMIRKYFNFLEKEDINTFNKIKENVYLICSNQNDQRIDRKNKKIDLGHPNFGRAGFCDEDGCQAPQFAKLEALNQTKQTLVKAWGTQEFLK